MPNNIKMEEPQRPLAETAHQASSHTGADRRWLRYTIPSSADLVFVVLLVGLSTGPLSIALLGDGGTGWHIRTGEWILKTRSVPRVDLFSTTMLGKPWYAWEWLYDAILGALHDVAGLNGVVLFTAFVIALTFALLLKRSLARGASLPIAVILLLVAFSASTVHFLARPHVVSWLFTLIWCEVLETFEANGKPRLLLWLPVLMIFWVNVHGGFLAGLIVLGIYLASDLAAHILSSNGVAQKGSRARVWKLAGVALAAFLATFANPRSYRLYIHIYQYLGDHFLMKHIEEFMSPNFHSVAQRCFAGLILLAIVMMAASWRRLPLRRWLLLLFAIASGLYAVRNIPVSSILIVWIAAPQLSMALHDYAKKRELAGARGLIARLDDFALRMTRFDATINGHLCPALVTMGAMVLCLTGGSIAGHRVMNAHFDQKRFPVQAVDYLAAHADGQPVFTIDRWGGYLIYRFYPKVVVAVDDRHDLYGPDFLINYLKIVHGEAGWESALESLHSGWALVPVDGPLARLLGHSERWKTVYRDDKAELFQKVLAKQQGSSGTAKQTILARVDIEAQQNIDRNGRISSRSGAEFPGR